MNKTIAELKAELKINELLSEKSRNKICYIFSEPDPDLNLNIIKRGGFVFEANEKNPGENFISQTKNKLSKILNATVITLIIAGIFVLWAA